MCFRLSNIGCIIFLFTGPDWFLIKYQMNVNQESVFRDTLYDSWVDKSINVILFYLLCTSSDVDFIFGSHH